jgi:tetratricopeptide (TPR) repeat protein
MVNDSCQVKKSKTARRRDLHNPGHLDAHPLVREYFGEQLRRLRMDTWKECNRRLFNHYRALAPELPDSFREMEPLFVAVICGCNAGLFRQALHEVYIPRIQRGDDSFAANILGARGALLSVLIHFFEDVRWESPVQTGAEGQTLSAEDQLFILIQAGVNMTALQEAAPEARICYERAESLCHSLNRPLLLYVALMGQFRYWSVTAKTAAAIAFAKRLYSLAQEQNDSTLMLGACTAMAGLHCTLGDFETSRRYTTEALQIAEALHFADRNSEALEILNEALALVEASGARCWSAQLYRLRGVFLTKLGADEAQIEEAFCRAIRTAKEQKSIFWTKRAEATYAEYRRQKASATRGGGFRLPIC